MRRLGLVARADDGGLGNLTREFARHLEPDAVLVVDLKGAGRGPVHPEWYDGEGARVHGEVRWSEGWPTDRDVEWLLERSDVVYSAEVLYHDRFLDLAEVDPLLTPREAAAARRVPVFLHVMPELWDPALSRADVLLPTPWYADRPRFSDAVHLPVPVACDRFAEARWASTTSRAYPRLLHFAGPAMLDRNGTELVAEAMRHLKLPAVLTVVGSHLEPPGGKVTLGQVEVRFVRSAAPDYWRNYEGHDVLVQPRRYGGLSLVHQEAAAAGLALVTLDRDPERGWPAVRVPTLPDPHLARMKGGMFSVEACVPRDLAGAVLSAWEHLDALRAASLEWAGTLDWTTWRPRYERLLRGR